MSLEDTFQDKTCICGHSIEDDHEIYPTRTACYALDFNGTIYSACDCRYIKVKPLIFLVKRDDEIPDNTSNNNREVGTKTKRQTIPKSSNDRKPINIIQWGKKKVS